MSETIREGFELAAAGISVALMGICGLRLLARLTRVIRGEETADGLPNSVAGRRSFAPRTALMAAAAAALVSRLAVYVLAYAMYRGLGVGESGLIESLRSLWIHWDTRHYIGIAQEGYTAVGDERLRLVFFPLYPLLMRLFSPLTGGDVFYAGLLISLLCSMGAAALVYDLAYMHFGRDTAARSVAYFLLSPLSVFLCCAYTEALFICLTLAAVCLLRRGHPWLAALFGAATALTRMPGVIVSGLMIIALIGRAARRQIDARAAVSMLGQVAVVFCGLFLYWGINYAVTGDPLMYMTYQKENWFQEPGTFWGSTANTMHYFLTTVGDGDWLFTWGFQLLCMMGIYMLLAFGEHLLPFDLAAYSFVYVAVVLAPTWLLSAPRYLYALCALPLLKARVPAGRAAHTAAFCVSFVLLLIWIFGYTIAIAVL